MNYIHFFNKLNRTFFIIISILIVFLINPKKIFAEDSSKTKVDTNSKVILTATEDWKPYYSKFLPNGGVMTEIVREAFKKSGYKLEIKWLPWARAYGLAKIGKYDGVLGVWYTSERSQFFTYSKPFFQTKIVFVKRKKDSIYYKNIEDLKSYSIGVERDSLAYETLKPLFGKKLEATKLVNQNIIKLKYKRIDLFVDEQLNILYTINTEFPELKDSFEILDPPFEINNLHVVISKKNPKHQEIVNSFNYGLDEIKKDGTFKKILKSYNLEKQLEKNK